MLVYSFFLVCLYCLVFSIIYDLDTESQTRPVIWFYRLLIQIFFLKSIVCIINGFLEKYNQYNHKNNQYNPYNPHHCIQMRANSVSINSFLTSAGLPQPCSVADVQSEPAGSSGSTTSIFSSNVRGVCLGISAAFISLIYSFHAVLRVGLNWPPRL